METSKRKHADDLLYQAKKQRIAYRDAGFGIITEGCSTAQASENIDVLSPSPEIEMPDDVPSDTCVNEKAIVLYKRANPELFMSKPIPRAPTIQLDMRFFTAGMLGPEFLSASDMLKQLESLRTTHGKSDLGSGGVAPNDVPDSRFALIPWVASPANMPAAGLKLSSANETATSQISSEAMKGDEMGEDALGSEAMDEDDGVYVIPSSQPTNPVNTLGTEPWQHYGLPPQPQFGSVTWSY